MSLSEITKIIQIILTEISKHLLFSHTGSFVLKCNEYEKALKRPFIIKLYGIIKVSVCPLAGVESCRSSTGYAALQF